MGIVFLEHCSTCESGAETLSAITSTGIGQRGAQWRKTSTSSAKVRQAAIRAAEL
jgi:hypothetical protein